MTDDQLRADLMRAVLHVGAEYKLAARLGISAGYFNGQLHGRRPIGPMLRERFGHYRSRVDAVHQKRPLAGE